jgi:hypothetical protein
MKLFLRYSLWMWIVFAGVLQAPAQTHLIDSLEKELKKSPQDSVAVYLYTGLGNEYFAYDTAKSQRYLEKGYALARKMDWHYALGHYYSVKGMLRQLAADTDKAHLFLDSAIFYFNQSIKAARLPKEVKNAKLEIAVCLYTDKDRKER